MEKDTIYIIYDILKKYHCKSQGIFSCIFRFSKGEDGGRSLSTRSCYIKDRNEIDYPISDDDFFDITLLLLENKDIPNIDWDFLQFYFYDKDDISIWFTFDSQKRWHF